MRRNLTPAPQGSLLDVDCKDRLDVTAAKAARIAVAGMEKNLGGFDLWNRGLGAVTEAFIRENVPPIGAVDVARKIGILKRTRGNR